MIISHKHKFIFIKPQKVAGTSMEINLAEHCGEGDIITPVSRPSKAVDSSDYKDLSQNQDGFYNHITPEEIKKKVGFEIWNNYFKFTIVRNPWDQVVSKYCHKKVEQPKTLEEVLHPQKLTTDSPPSFFKRTLYFLKNKIIKNDFPLFVRMFPKRWKNTKYYFDRNGSPYCDLYIKFEDLDEGHKKVCEYLNIPYQPLIKTKDKIRKKDRPYTDHYDQKSRNIVYNKFRKEIDYFNYSFGQ